MTKRAPIREPEPKKPPHGEPPNSPPSRKEPPTNEPPREEPDDSGSPMKVKRGMGIILMANNWPKNACLNTLWFHWATSSVDRFRMCLQTQSKSSVSVSPSQTHCSNIEVSCSRNWKDSDRSRRSNSHSLEFGRHDGAESFDDSPRMSDVTQRECVAPRMLRAHGVVRRIALALRLGKTVSYF